MAILSHDQARRWLHNLPELDARQRAALQTHLEACAGCRAYAGMTARLSAELPAAVPYPRITPQEESRRQAEVLQKAAGRSGRQRLTGGLGELSWVGLAAVLVLALSWILRTSLPRTSPAQLAETTPTQAPTATPPAFLSMASTPDEVRMRITNPSWGQMSLTAYTRRMGSGGEQVDRYVQAWLRRDGRGRVVISSDLPAGYGLDGSVLASQAWGSDGQQVVNYDFSSGAGAPAQPAWYFHPLEGVDPAIAMVLPGMFMTLSSEPQLIEETTLDGLPALVVDWGGSRLWVDTVTGMVLRRESTDENGLAYETGILKADQGSPLPDWAGQTAGLENSTFLLSEVAVAEPSPTPETIAAVEPTQAPFATPAVEAPPSSEATPTPLPVEYTPVDGAILLPVSNPAVDGSGDGQPIPNSELYFTQRSVGPTFSRFLSRVALDCLLTADVCEAQTVPGAPEMSDAPVTWSPDGSQAAWIDHNNRRIMLYERAVGTWRTLVENTLATMDLVVWAADGSSFVATLQGSDSQNSLATRVRVSDGNIDPLAPALGGLQIPLGWPGPQSLLVLVDRPVAKGSGDQASAPVMAVINTSDGTWTEIPAAGDSAWLGSYPALSPDGQWLALQMTVDGSMQLALLSLDGQQVRPLGVNGVMPAWSPDGNWISFINTGENSSTVYTIHPDGSGVQAVFEWPAFPSVYWLPGSQHLVIQTWPAPGATPDSDRSALYLAALDGSRTLRLTLADNDTAVELVYPAVRP